MVLKIIKCGKLFHTIWHWAEFDNREVVCVRSIASPSVEGSLKVAASSYSVNKDFSTHEALVTCSGHIAALTYPMNFPEV